MTLINQGDGTLQFAEVNGVRLAYTTTGDADVPLLLVHGSWGSHNTWDPVVAGLSQHFRVVAYDRRGHSASSCPPCQGSFREDVADLAALIERLGLAPAWVAGNSAGACITLQLAAARPEMLRGIIVHEPPLWSLIEEGTPAAAALAQIESGPLAEAVRRIAAGDHKGGAQQFVDQVALGPGAWAGMPEPMRRTMVENAPTFLDEDNDPDSRSIDEAALTRFHGPVLLTSGDQSPPIFEPVLDRIHALLPQAARIDFEGAGHIPHVTHPGEYVEEVVAFGSTA